MTISITIEETELKKLIIAELETKLGNIPLNKVNVTILVKSKQNYKSEWEQASFKAEYNHRS